MFSLKRHLVLRWSPGVWGRVFPPRNDDLALPFPPGRFINKWKFPRRHWSAFPAEETRTVSASIISVCCIPSYGSSKSSKSPQKKPSWKLILGPETRPARLAPKGSKRIIFQPSIFRGENVRFTVDFLKTNRYLPWKSDDWKMMKFHLNGRGTKFIHLSGGFFSCQGNLNNAELFFLFSRVLISYCWWFGNPATVTNWDVCIKPVVNNGIKNYRSINWLPSRKLDKLAPWKKVGGRRCGFLWG